MERSRFIARKDRDRPEASRQLSPYHVRRYEARDLEKGGHRGRDSRGYSADPHASLCRRTYPARAMADLRRLRAPERRYESMRLQGPAAGRSVGDAAAVSYTHLTLPTK